MSSYREKNYYCVLYIEFATANELILDQICKACIIYLHRVWQIFLDHPVHTWYPRRIRIRTL